jgi:hypothetical protein
MMPRKKVPSTLHQWCPRRKSPAWLSGQEPYCALGPSVPLEASGSSLCCYRGRACLQIDGLSDTKQTQSSPRPYVKQKMDTCSCSHALCLVPSVYIKTEGIGTCRNQMYKKVTQLKILSKSYDFNKQTEISVVKCNFK